MQYFFTEITFNHCMRLVGNCSVEITLNFGMRLVSKYFLSRNTKNHGMRFVLKYFLSRNHFEAWYDTLVFSISLVESLFYRGTH